MTLVGRDPVPIPSRIETLMYWLPRIAVALVFLSVGSQKFSEGTMWVPIFARIGFGQWFRYLTGVMQVGGAVLILIPPLAIYGVAMLACTMAGAVVVWVSFNLTGNALIPAALLLVLLVLGWGDYQRHSLV